MTARDVNGRRGKEDYKKLLPYENEQFNEKLIQYPEKRNRFKIAGRISDGMISYLQSMKWPYLCCWYNSEN